MAVSNDIINNTIKPHGGELINRALEGQERETLIQQAQDFPSVTLNPWSLSDLELIGIGGFSPLTGFMGEADYNKVVEDTHLANGLVWSIPITLPVDEAKADELNVGDRVALYGEDGELYGVLDLEEKFSYDKEKEAREVYGTTDDNHPGVKKFMKKAQFISVVQFIY